MKLSPKQTTALAYLKAQSESVLLIEFLSAGNSLKTLVALVDKGAVEWTSSYRIPSNVTPAEYEEARDTTSYVVAL